MSLPSLTSLRAFEASARLGSFTRAAEEIHVTQAAVSQQIRLLEQMVGGALFQRQSRRVLLTDLGRMYLALMGSQLRTIESAFETVRAVARPDVLVIRSTLTLAEHWLMPRLHGFVAEHPLVPLSLTTFNTRDHTSLDMGDLIFSTGRNSWPGFRETLLFSQELVAVASPSFLERHAPFELSPAVANHVIHTMVRRDDWPTFCRGVGLPPFTLDKGTILGNSSLSYAAAENGLGIVVAEKELVSKHLASGRMVKVHEAEVKADRGYYLLEPLGLSRKPMAQVFVDWILKEAGASGGA